MKISLILFGTLFLIFIVIQVYSMSSQKNIETYPYVVKKKYDSFEIRTYEATLFTSVKLTTNKYSKASSQGFSKLAGYIFGGNDRNEKIAMTSPVAMSMEDSMTMMFMVPKNLSKETLPKPNSSEIEFKEVPSKTVAAITFGGWANTDKIEEYKQLLIKNWIKKESAIPLTFSFLAIIHPTK